MCITLIFVTGFKMSRIGKKKIEKSNENQMTVFDIEGVSGALGHGGKRDGSGRKKKEATQVMRIPVSLVEQVKLLIASHSQPAPQDPETPKDAKTIILSMHKDGRTFVEIANELNRMKMPSASGNEWNKDMARGIVRRAK